MNDQVIVYTFDQDTPNRLDKFLVERLPGFTRSRLQTIIRNGNVVINGESAYKTGQMLDRGMIIEITLPAIQSSELIPEDIPLAIIFENQDLMVVNKPAGMVVHPAAGHATGTLVHAALAHSPELEGIGGVKRPGVVHRLDKDTSGIIVLAKNDRAHQWLQNQFRDRQVKKVYLALVDGQPPTPDGKIDAPIGRDTSQRKRMAITSSQRGREAVSIYKTIETFDKHALLEVYPHTGRTHQIRVHLAFIECPIAGDMIYGRRHSSLPIKRHFLHAHQLQIIIPGEAVPRTFEAPLPEELSAIIATLRR